MDFNVKQAIIDRLLETRRNNILVLFNYMSKNGFFTYHCHGHHQYEGGLADHAWQTYQIALRLNVENHKKNPTAPLLNEDSIAIAALLHDLCNCSGFLDVPGHGRRSAKIIKAIGFVLTDEEYLAIRFHMSLKGKESHFRYEDAKRSQLRYLIHKADGISAHLHQGYEDSFALVSQS
jgi:HD superfamily phosphodiesterase